MRYPANGCRRDRLAIQPGGRRRHRPGPRFPRNLVRRISPLPPRRPDWQATPGCDGWSATRRHGPRRGAGKCRRPEEGYVSWLSLLYAGEHQITGTAGIDVQAGDRAIVVAQNSDIEPSAEQVARGDDPEA